ncbi:aspartyl-tRNA(Asn)/glutamyl-tRNA(Gln) amidotransferase subunit C [Desulfohalotomaculum tongense]|uniref:Asp-tRNA(Asn)/Glu-tRNA(Gln) amidotransferase subunit GatC n=1 Tax=Desulforadius tongensis TaxID=1216062 RepID=UPI001957819C|nr:Asp-tRNA(Asn)/Glu-tRNA(Gln) amidotransferase subunit GatC [Desulforadius tongensis]MBM7854274.1 aspartyl-tRNA(Asn)/glutamyl-tRNA(Gln) amidotransferase subunit C [Desulforadius tongensis]
MISKKDVEHVALLARLELKEEEKEMYTRQLNDILKYAHKLQQLNTEDVTPTAHVLPIKNVFREDQVGDHLPNEKALANAPDKEGNYIKVPKIM